jgi:acetyl esterase
VLVVPAAVLALGTFMPGLPYVGTAGTWAFPTFAGPFLLAGLAGAMFALGAARLGARRAGRALAVIGLLTAVGAGIVIARHARIAAAHGVPVNLLATVLPRGAGTGARADETHIYAQADGHPLELDLYRPTGRPGVLAPVAIYVHGGGWIHGDRTANAATVRWLAGRGYLGVSLDYVLATAEKPTWQTAASQVACALSWVTANATKYGGDPERVFVFGESAGGALALTTSYAAAAGVATSSCGGQMPAVRAVAAQVPALDPVTFYQNPDPIAGAFSRQMVSRYLGGTPMDHPDRARAVSSATYITPKAPPTLLILSNNDHLVPIEGALTFIDRATQAGVPLRILRFPSADHGVGQQYYSVVNQTWRQVMQQHFCRYGGACG